MTETSSTNFKAWATVFLGALFYCYQFILRVSPNVMTDELMSAYAIDAAALGVVISLYYYGYSGMQIFLGVSMDRIGARRIISAAALVCACATSLFALSSNLYCASMARLLIGVGSACGYLGTLKLGSQWLPKSQMPFVVAVAMLLGTLGANIGGLPLEYVLNIIGWNNALLLISGIGIALSACIFFFGGKNPPKPADPPEGRPVFKDVIAIAKKPQAWLISLFAMLMYVPLAVIGDLWGISFLESKFSIPESKAAIAVSSMFWGVGIGAPLFGWATVAMNNRRVPMVLGAAMTLFIYILIIYMPGISFESICALFFLAGLFFNGQCISFTCIYEIMPDHAGGVAVGFLNSIVMTSGIFFLPMVGRILVHRWDGTELNNVPIYSIENFEVALIVLPMSLLLALLLLFFIKDTAHLSDAQEK